MAIEAKNFGARLKSLRKSKRLSQEQVAKKIGISKSALGFYENGEHKPDIYVLDLFVKEFGVSVEYLLGYTDAQDRENVSIGDQTGLSEKAIKNICAITDNGIDLSPLLEYDGLQKITESLLLYKEVVDIEFYYNTAPKAVDKILKSSFYSEKIKRMIEYEHYVETTKREYINDIFKYELMACVEEYLQIKDADILGEISKIKGYREYCFNREMHKLITSIENGEQPKEKENNTRKNACKEAVAGGCESFCKEGETDVCENFCKNKESDGCVNFHRKRNVDICTKFHQAVKSRFEQIIGRFEYNWEPNSSNTAPKNNVYIETLKAFYEHFDEILRYCKSERDRFNDS